MLTDLQIRNLAIIDSLHVSFGPGLTVLTGETGAGKSIIIDAVGLVLGERATADLIRTGADEASVEAVFDISGRPELLAMVRGTGVEIEGELLVRRTISRSGRNRVFIAGGLSTTAILGDLSRQLVNIYGQHESQTLLRPESHLRLLDSFAGLLPLRGAYEALFDEYRLVLGQMQRLEEGEREAARQLDLLSFQTMEIGQAALRPGEDVELEQERRLLVNAEKLLAGSQEAFAELYGNDDAVLGRIDRVATTVAELARLDPSLANSCEALRVAAAQLEDAALQLRDYGSRIEADQTHLAAVDDRIDLIRRLTRKYGATIAAVLDYQAEVERELALLQGRDEMRGELVGTLRDLEGRLAAMGSELAAKRRSAAQEMQKAMERELHDLAMRHARFVIRFEELAEAGRGGLERADFLFSPNPGEEPRPLARIASGGELSRIMLALKQLLPDSDVPTLVFDEVDAGIGGATSALVGRKLRKVAAGQQVLCITHLPQVAAFADHHYRVVKEVVDGRTVTCIESLAGDDRVAEMARMLGGMSITQKTLDHAQEMLATAAD